MFCVETLKGRKHRIEPELLVCSDAFDVQLVDAQPNDKIAPCGTSYGHVPLNLVDVGMAPLQSKLLTIEAQTKSLLAACSEVKNFVKALKGHLSVFL